jgi:hypothetical protein
LDAHAGAWLALNLKAASNGAETVAHIREPVAGLQSGRLAALAGVLDREG